MYLQNNSAVLSKIFFIDGILALLLMKRLPQMFDVIQRDRPEANTKPPHRKTNVCQKSKDLRMKIEKLTKRSIENRSV